MHDLDNPPTAKSRIVVNNPRITVVTMNKQSGLSTALFLAGLPGLDEELEYHLIYWLPRLIEDWLSGKPLKMYVCKSH